MNADSSTEEEEQNIDFLIVESFLRPALIFQQKERSSTGLAGLSGGGASSETEVVVPAFRVSSTLGVTADADQTNRNLTAEGQANRNLTGAVPGKIKTAVGKLLVATTTSKQANRNSTVVGQTNRNLIDEQKSKVNVKRTLICEKSGTIEKSFRSLINENQRILKEITEKLKYNVNENKRKTREPPTESNI